MGGGRESQDALLFVRLRRNTRSRAASCPWSSSWQPLLPLQAIPGWQPHAPGASLPQLPGLLGAPCPSAPSPGGQLLGNLAAGSQVPLPPATQRKLFELARAFSEKTKMRKSKRKHLLKHQSYPLWPGTGWGGASGLGCRGCARPHPLCGPRGQPAACPSAPISATTARPGARASPSHPPPSFRRLRSCPAASSPFA